MDKTYTVGDSVPTPYSTTGAHGLFLTVGEALDDFLLVAIFYDLTMAELFEQLLNHMEIPGDPIWFHATLPHLSVKQNDGLRELYGNGTVLGVLNGSTNAAEYLLETANDINKRMTLSDWMHRLNRTLEGDFDDDTE